MESDQHQLEDRENEIEENNEFLVELNNLELIGPLTQYVLQLPLHIERNQDEESKDEQIDDAMQTDQNEDNENDGDNLKVEQQVKLYTELPIVDKMPTKDALMSLLQTCFYAMSSSNNSKTYKENRGKSMPFMFGIDFMPPKSMQVKHLKEGFKEYGLAECIRRTLINFYLYFQKQEKLRYISLDADGQRVLKLHKELNEVIKKPNRDELRSLLIDIYCSLFNTSKQDGYLYQREKGAKLDFLFHIPFKNIHEINNNDIEEKVRPQYTLTECLEMSVIRAYEQYNQIKKLKYLEDDELDINELPSGNELLASNNKFNTFSKTILMLDKFDRRSRFTKSTRISKHFDRPLYNSNYHLNYNIIEAIEIINRAYTDLNIPLPDNFVEKCNESINNNVRKIMIQTNKLIMPCDQCERNDETVSYYYDEEHDLLINCKLCEECSLNYQINKNEIDKNPEECRKLIDDALNSLKTKSINFLKGVTDKVGNTCKIYLVTIGGTSFKDVDYSGFTSTMVRIPTHVLLLAVFFKFNLNVKPFTHYYKYKKWKKNQIHNIIQKYHNWRSVVSGNFIYKNKKEQKIN